PSQLLQIKLSELLRTSIVALYIMRHAIRREQIAEIHPQSRLRVMGIAVLKPFDISEGFGFMKATFELRQSRPNCGQIVAGRRFTGRRQADAARRDAKRGEKECPQLCVSHFDVS